jgi:hypothetical protein
VEALLAPIKEISKIQHLDVEPQIELGREDIRNAEKNVDIGPLISV